MIQHAMQESVIPADSTRIADWNCGAVQDGSPGWSDSVTPSQKIACGLRRTFRALIHFGRCRPAGAVKYADLLPNRQSDYVFSWDRMLVPNPTFSSRAARGRSRASEKHGARWARDLSCVEYGERKTLRAP